MTIRPPAGPPADPHPHPGKAPGHPHPFTRSWNWIVSACAPLPHFSPLIAGVDLWLINAPDHLRTQSRPRPDHRQRGEAPFTTSRPSNITAPLDNALEADADTESCGQPEGMQRAAYRPPRPDYRDSGTPPEPTAAAHQAIDRAAASAARRGPVRSESELQLATAHAARVANASSASRSCGARRAGRAAALHHPAPGAGDRGAARSTLRDAVPVGVPP